MKFELKDICFFDCETTGVPAKGLKWDADFNQFPHVVQLAWAFGDKERSFIIKPDNYEIPPPHRLYVRTTFISIRRC